MRFYHIFYIVIDTHIYLRYFFYTLGVISNVTFYYSLLSQEFLNRTDIATDEDKAYGIDNWVKIFKAKTWEELRILSENNKYVEEMVRSLFKFNSDEQIREQCEDIEIELAARKALLKEHNIEF